MLTRIVRMTFLTHKTDEFLALFDASKHLIRAMPGCRSLQLLRDHHHPEVFTTISVWESEQALNDYRDSALFKEVWARTKLLFAAKPLAFSNEVLREL